MWWQRPPLSAFLLVGAAAGMLVPAVFAWRSNVPGLAQTFALCAAGTLLAAALVTLALMNRNPRITARAQLATLLGGYVVLPAIAALPLYLAAPWMGFERAYVEMVSCLTTTGVSLAEPGSLAPTLHLWRATVAWLGGFLIILSALAIMAPLNLGGYEMQSVIHGARPGEGWASLGVAEASLRLMRTARRLGPVYLGLTALLALLLATAGDAPVDAVIHAMSVLSTSGISGQDAGLGGGAGRLAEMIALPFLILAATNRGPQIQFSRGDLDWLRTDPELRIMLAVVLSAALLILLRHVMAQADEMELLAILAAAWGAVFTALSFLTTTGFVSGDWPGGAAAAHPGLLLLVLATLGGGIASTAGGIKLLRSYAIMQQGLREMGRLSHPNSLGGDGETARRLRQAGAYIAWVFLMLFLVALALVFAAFALAGLEFDAALALSIASLTNTGPVYAVGAPNAPGFGEIGTGARLVAVCAMILGRLEALAVLALLNPENWRR
ncbi:MAG: potassium transporter TrkG [Pseudomonadota bacterium]